MTLPYDFARCTTQNCPLAGTCARKDPGRPDGPQAIAQFGGSENCHGYITKEDEK